MDYIFESQTQAKKLTGLSYIGSINSSAKMVKNKKVSNQYTYVIYLAPSNTSGYNVCKYASKECKLGCLATSGRAAMELNGGITRIENARIKKTRLFKEHQEFFMKWVISEINTYKRKAERDGYGFSIRLNGTSDIDWSKVLIDGKNIFEIFSDVQFYDYTKDYQKMINNNVPNYHLTFSYTGRNEAKSFEVLNSKKNVAMVFNVPKKQPLPTEYNGYPVIDGDLTDYRKDDGKGVIVGLRWKRIANKTVEKEILNSVFVVSL